MTGHVPTRRRQAAPSGRAAPIPGVLSETLRHAVNHHLHANGKNQPIPPPATPIRPGPGNLSETASRAKNPRYRLLASGRRRRPRPAH